MAAAKEDLDELDELELSSEIAPLLLLLLLELQAVPTSSGLYLTFQK